MANSGDRTVEKLQSVRQIGSVGLIAKPRSKHRVEQEVSTSVSREHSSCTICSVSSWGKTNDEQTPIRFAKIGNGLSPVFVVLIRLSLFDCGRLAVSNQSITLSAIDDLMIERIP